MAEGSALKAMVTFFTIWQQEITMDDMDAMNRKFHLAPIVGAFIGLVVLLVATVLYWLNFKIGFGGSLFTAAVLLMTVYVGSRFLHFDGLADFGDGSIVAGTQEDHIRALKDTLLGAGGLGVALIVTLLNFSEYAMAGFLIVVFAPVTEVLVKNAQVAAAAYGNPGNGMAGRQVGETSVGSMYASTGISLALVLVLGTLGCVATNLIHPIDLVEYLPAVLAVLVGLVASIAAGYYMAHRANRVFGMVNGDILGATNEISRAVVMAVMVLAYLLVV